MVLLTWGTRPFASSPFRRRARRFPETADDVRSLSWRELQIVAARLIGEPPDDAEHATVIANVVPPMIENGTAST
jgi:hypothetical protein